MPIANSGSILDKQVGKPICKCPAGGGRAVAAAAQVGRWCNCSYTYAHFTSLSWMLELTSATFFARGA